MNVYKDLNDNEFKVLKLIHEWQTGGKEHMTPSQEWISKKTGKCRATVYRALASLKAKGAING